MLHQVTVLLSVAVVGHSGNVEVCKPLSIVESVIKLPSVPPELRGGFGRNPGFALRVTKKGLDYMKEKASEIINQKISEGPPSNEPSPTLGAFMKLLSFNPPTYYFDLLPPRRFRIGFVDGEYQVKAHWGGKRHYGFDVYVGLAGISAHVEAALGKTEEGRPNLSSATCAATIRSFSTEVEGGSSSSWRGGMDSGKKILESHLCAGVKNLLSQVESEILDNLPMNIDIRGGFMLNRGMTENPSVTSQYIQSKHEGVISYYRQSVVPFYPYKLITEGTDTDKMLYLYVSDYMLNSAAYLAHKNGLLRYTLNETQFRFMRWSCPGQQCIGSFIPEIAKLYPDGELHLTLHSTQMPYVAIETGAANLNAHGILQLEAMSKSSRTLLLNASVSLAAQWTPKAEGLQGVWSSKITRLHVNVIQTVFPEKLNTAVMQKIADANVRASLEEWIDKISKDEFLTVSKTLKLQNPQIIMRPHTLVFNSDFRSAA